VQAGTFALLAPTLSYLNLPKWKCPTEILKSGQCAVFVMNNAACEQPSFTAVSIDCQVKSTRRAYVSKLKLGYM